MDPQNMPFHATVALVDWTMPGHHDTYMRLFIRTLLDSGHQVIALWPAPEQLLDSEKLQHETTSGEKKTPRFATAYFSRSKYPLWPSSLRYWAEAKTAARYIREALASCEKQLGAKCDFIFFNTFYEKQYWLVKALANACGRPWSFLYLHTSSLPPHSCENPNIMQLLQHPMLRAVGVLDERSIAPGEYMTGRKFVHFPDFTNEKYEENHPFERDLRAFKGNAPLILAIGHLQKAKGIMTLAELALNSSSSHLKFAFVGEGRLKRGTLRSVVKLLRNKPNVLFKLGRIPDGVAYNACIHASDILFAAYHDFAHSSNTLTKAAVFERPVIVSDGHLMAERTRKYRLGEIVKQKDPESALEGIIRITNDYQGWVSRNKPEWNTYRQLHSTAQMKCAFASLLSAYGLG